MVNAVYPIIGKQTNLPFYLTGIGISDPEYHVKRERGLVSHQFLFTSSGKGILSVGGNSYIQNKGSIFYLSPTVPHEYCPCGDEWTANWLVFRGSYADVLLEELGFDKFNTADMISGYEQLYQIFYRILAAAEQFDGEDKASVLIYEFIMAAKESMLSSFAENSGAGSVVENAVKYIKHNYCKDITLDELSRISGISLQHFCRVFKNKTGMRPMEYIARTRVSKAKSLLVNTSESICDIGKSVGYEDQNYFGIVFKKYEGISPSEYRRLKDSVVL